MNRDDIIRMAREAGGHAYTNRHTKEEPAFAFSIDRLERFAALVAAAGAEKELAEFENLCKGRWAYGYEVIRARRNGGEK